VPYDTKNLAKWVNNVAIKTSRYIPLSSFYSLDDYVSEKIAKPLIACCTMGMTQAICATGICKKDAVIIIKPSSVLSKWDISHRWEHRYR
jgi:hypothetical protein